jgi:phosphate transport system substrate-binding protein
MTRSIDGSAARSSRGRSCGIQWWIGLFTGLTLVVTGSAAAGAKQDGSSAVEIQAYGRLFDLGQALLRAYERAHPGSGITIVDAPAGMGMACMYHDSCAGVLLGRPPMEEEYRQVKRRTKKPLVATPIAMDAVVFFAHPENPIVELTLEQLRDALTYRIHDWRDLGVDIEVDPRNTCALCLALAQSGMGFDPDRHRTHERRIAQPRTSADTGDPAVVEHLLLEGKSMGIGTRDIGRTSGVVGDVRADILALGMGGMDHESDVKVLGIKADGSSPPILPDERSVRDRTYPLAHYIFLSTAGSAGGRLREFSRWILSPEGQQVIREARIGPVPLPSAE